MRRQCEMCGKTTSQSHLCPQCQSFAKNYFLMTELARVVSDPNVSDQIKQWGQRFSEALKAAQGK